MFKRWLSNIAVLFSLILFMALVVFWVRGIWRMDCFGVAIDHFHSPDWIGRSCTFSSFGGQVAVRWRTHSANKDAGQLDLWIIPPDRWEWKAWPMCVPLHPSMNVLINHPQLGDETPGWERLGFAYGSGNVSQHQAWGQFWFLEIIVPNWALALLFAACPAVVMRQRRRERRRVAAGLCVCGYDLRASADRCPECGRAVRASVEPAI